jgi:hypothetical protein
MRTPPPVLINLDTQSITIPGEVVLPPFPGAPSSPMLLGVSVLTAAHALGMFKSRFAQLSLHFDLETMQLPVYDAEFDATSRRTHAERFVLL